MSLRLLDRPEVRLVLFHPRAEPSSGSIPGVPVLVPVEPGVGIGGRLHLAERVPSALVLSRQWRNRI